MSQQSQQNSQYQQLNTSALSKLFMTEVKKNNIAKAIEIMDYAKTINASKFLATSTDSDGNTALNYAAKFNSAELCEILIDAEANMLCANVGKWTPLHFASHYGAHNAAKVLLGKQVEKEGVDGLRTMLDAKNDFNRTALETAIVNKKPDNIVKLLTDTLKTTVSVGESSADDLFVKLKNVKGEDIAKVKEIVDTAKSLDVAKFLAQKICQDINTALHYAAKINSAELCELLIDAGANMLSANKGKWTPLHFASNYKAYDAVKVLFGKQVEKEGVKGLRTMLDAKDEFGNSAFIVAMNKRDVTAQEQLNAVQRELIKLEAGQITVLEFCENANIFVPASLLVDAPQVAPVACSIDEYDATSADSSGDVTSAGNVDHPVADFD